MTIDDVLKVRLTELAIVQKGGPSEIGKAVIDAWKAYLGEVDPQALNKAFLSWGKSEVFFPTVKDIERMARYMGQSRKVVPVVVEEPESENARLSEEELRAKIRRLAGGIGRSL